MTYFYLVFKERSGGDSKVDTPVPIPNTEVKHFHADGSKLNLARVGSCQAVSLINILFPWRFSSVGRAFALQAKGQRFEPVNLHHYMPT